MKTLSVILGCVSLAGCSVALPARLDVPLALSTVQRPQDVAQRWGEYTLAPADTTGYTYDDDLLSLAVVPLSGSFSVFVRNKSEHSIRLLWSEASYVGPDGISSGVVPGETRWMDWGNTPGPQVIPARASAALSAIPRATADASEMEINPFYTGLNCNAAKDSEIRLILPLEIQGTVNEYTLQFEPRGDLAIVEEKMDTMMGAITQVSRRPC